MTKGEERNSDIMARILKTTIADAILMKDCASVEPEN